MQLPNLQASNAASSTAAPKKQQSIRPQSGGLMKASMTKSLMPDKGNEIKPTSATPEPNSNMARSTMAKPQAKSATSQTNRYTPTTMGVTSDMRVEDRVMGLMSEDNPLMQKAREQANRYSASKGLQSSSIATENATNAMFNAALPIAQQDANTYTTTAQLNNQNAHDVGMQDNASLNQLMLNKDSQQFTASESAKDRSFQEQLQQNQQDFQSGENQADRGFQQELEQLRYENSLGMLDAEGEQRMRELESQQSFQAEQTQADREFNAGENQANRDFQMEMEKFKTASQLEVNMALQDDMQAFNQGLEEMRNAHQMGMLDAEGEQRMRELEAQNENAISQMDRSAEIQTSRDNLLQSFRSDEMKMEMANRLTEIEAQAKAQLELQSNQNDFAQKMEYSNAVSQAVNFGIEALGNAFMNPEIDPSQYTNIQNQINRMVQDRIGEYEDIYGIGGDIPTPEPFSEFRGNEDAAGGNNTIPGGTATGDESLPRNIGGGIYGHMYDQVIDKLTIDGNNSNANPSAGGGSPNGLMGSAENGRFNTDLPPTAIR